MANSTEIALPDIGDFQDVDVIEVLVAPGDRVAVEDPLIAVESDKASMDVPSPESGIVEAIHVAAGDKVSAGSVILTLEVAEAETRSPPQEAVTESSSRAESPPNSTPVPASKRLPPVPVELELDQGRYSSAHAAPSVRRYARELGVDLRAVSGSGRKGRILQSDVQEFIKAVMSAGQAPVAAAETAAGMAIPAIPAVDFSQFGAINVEPLQRIKKLSGTHLHRAWLNVPMVTHHDQADVTDLEAFRKSLQAEAERREVRLTTLAFLTKALAAALKAFPSFNVSLTPEAENLVYKHYFHVGIAVDTTNGLVVPVFRNVDRKSVFDLAAEMGAMSGKARDGKLTPGDMQGGCMTISSLGGIGGCAFTPIVNAPEVAILGVTRARMKPVWNGDEFVPRLMLPLDLTYDHRVIDGAEAARFMVYFCRLLADVRRLIL